MSQSLLQKSLKLFEEDDKSNSKVSTLKKPIKKIKNQRKKRDSPSNKDAQRSNLEKNLKAFRLMKKLAVPKEVSQKIISHTVKAHIPLVAKKTQESVFTEEDFRAFEEEYVLDE